MFGVTRPSLSATHVTTTSLSANASASSSKATTSPETLGGERATPVGRPVGDGDVGGPRLAQRRGDPGAHVAGADDEHASSGKAAQPIDGEFDSGVTDRCRAPSDRRLGACSFAGTHGVAEQQVERRPGSSAVDGRLPRRLHLAEDLTLAEDERVESGGNLEEVRRRGIVVERDQVGMQLVERASLPAPRGTR